MLAQLGLVKKKYSSQDLLIAAGAGNIVEVINILNAGVYVNTKVIAKNMSWTRALHKAAANGHLTTVQLLVARGAEVDAVDSEGNTSLVLAVYQNHTDVIDVLKANGAQIDIVDRNRYPEKNALLRAALAGEADKVELLKLHGAKIDGCDSFTPLTRAVWDCQSVTAVKTLLEAGAKVDQEERPSKYTALHYAAHYELTDIMQLLIAAGANVEKRVAASYLTPLYTAVLSAKVEAVAILTAAGASAHADLILKNKDYAVESDDIRILLMLLEATKRLDEINYNSYVLHLPELLLDFIEAAIHHATARAKPVHVKAIAAIASTAMAAGVAILDDPSIAEPRIIPVIAEAACEIDMSRLEKVDISTFNTVLDRALVAKTITPESFPMLNALVQNAAWARRSAAVAEWKEAHLLPAPR